MLVVQSPGTSIVLFNFPKPLEMTRFLPSCTSLWLLSIISQEKSNPIRCVGTSRFVPSDASTERLQAEANLTHRFFQAVMQESVIKWQNRSGNFLRSGNSNATLYLRKRVIFSTLIEILWITYWIWILCDASLPSVVHIKMACNVWNFTQLGKSKSYSHHCACFNFSSNVWANPVRLQKVECKYRLTCKWISVVNTSFENCGMQSMKILELECGGAFQEHLSSHRKRLSYSNYNLRRVKI